MTWEAIRARLSLWMTRALRSPRLSATESLTILPMSLWGLLLLFLSMLVDWPCNSSVTISSACRAKDILNVDIVSVDEPSPPQKDVPGQSKITVKRPIAKRAGRSMSECSLPMVQPQAAQVLPNVRKPQPEVQPYPEIPNSNGKVGPGEWNLIIFS